VATVVLGAASTRLRLDARLDRLQAQTRGALLEKEVAARFSLPEDVLLVMNTGQDLEQMLETDQRLQKTLAERMAEPAHRSVGFLRRREGRQAGVAGVLAESKITSEAARGEIEAVARRTGFRENTFAPFFERLPRLLDPAARVSYEGLLAHGLDSVVSRFL